MIERNVEVSEKDLGKRKIHEVDSKLPIESYLKGQAAVDNFGGLNILSADKFGALQALEVDQPNFDRGNQNTADSSTGSFTPADCNVQEIGTPQCTDVTLSGNKSNWSKYIDLEGAGTSRLSDIQGFQDPHSHSSTPRSCALDERTFTGSEGPPLKRLCTPPDHNVGAADMEPGPSQDELSDLRIVQQTVSEQEIHNRSLPTSQSRFSVDRTRVASISTPTVRFNIEGTVLTPDSPHSSQSNRQPMDLNHGWSYEPPTSNEYPRSSAVAESSENPRQYHAPFDQRPDSFRYRFASASVEASLLQRLEERQTLQETNTSRPTTHRGERCAHVISPEDLIWGSVKNYCGMVLDRETRVVLGTAVLFIPPDPGQQEAHFPRSGKSAWVTSVKVVEGRTEILIKNSKGGIHVAQLLLTSTALGLALFNVHLWQGTFALAFLSRVTGPASLPHRFYVDVDRSDRVYVFGYEEPWEAESGTTADVRVRPGRIIDAGRHAIVEIDFTAGQLGGSIGTPAGFQGGMIVRADGLLAGVVTGEILENHMSKIDFSYAYNIYALLEEL